MTRDQQLEAEVRRLRTLVSRAAGHIDRLSQEINTIRDVVGRSERERDGGWLIEELERQ